MIRLRLNHGDLEPLRQHRTVAIEPFWPQIRAVLDVSVLPALLPPGPPEQE